MIRVLMVPTVFLLVLGVGCFLLSAKSSSKTDESAITFCIGDEIKTLDPGRMSWMNDIRVAMCIWEGLTAYDPDTLEPVPGVAESWEVSSDGMVYTFRLRKDTLWSNGDAVTAADFIFAWRRVLTPSTGADYIGLFKYIVGAEEYTDALDKNESADFSTVGISSPDPHTLVVRLKAPCSYFLDTCAFPPFFPLHEKSMRPFLLESGTYQNNWARPPYIVGNGAYVLREWKFKQFLAFEPNPNYWDRRNVRCEKLFIKSITDPRTSLLAYQQGSVDVVQFPGNPQFGEDLIAARDAGRNDINYRPVFGSYYYAFNCTREPFNDPRVRKALALAVDKDKIVNDVTRLKQQPLGVIVPPDSIVGYTSPTPLAMNIDEAKKLLADAGYPDGKGFPTVEILVNSEVKSHEIIALAIGQMWQKSLGIQSICRSIERSSFGEARRAGNFTVSRAGWYGDYVDPTTWLDILRSTDGNNDGKFSNPAYDALLDQAATEHDSRKRLAILSEAEALLVHEQFPIIPLYQYSDGLIFDPERIEGLSLNVRMLTPLKWIRRK